MQPVSVMDVHFLEEISQFCYFWGGRDESLDHGGKPRHNDCMIGMLYLKLFVTLFRRSSESPRAAGRLLPELVRLQRVAD